MQEPQFATRADRIDRSELEQVELPEQVRDEIPTLNKMGYMKQTMDEYCQGFVELASKSKEYFLEIGCAYGFVAKEALKRGGKIIACDLNFGHLSYLVSTAPNEYLKNLYICNARFPEDLDIPSESLEGILASRIMLFLRPKQMEEGFRKIHKWLKKGGKLFFVTVSPYNDSLRDKILPQYLERVKEGNKWPGEMDNLQDVALHKDFVGEYINVFDVDHLKTLLPEFGFKIDKIDYFVHEGDPIGGNKGHVGFIATKVLD